MLAVIEAKYLKDFKIRLTFNNGKSGEVDLQKILIITDFGEDIIFELSITYDNVEWSRSLFMGL